MYFVHSFCIVDLCVRTSGTSPSLYSKFIIIEMILLSYLIAFPVHEAEWYLGLKQECMVSC